jgi:hypothetical protein
MALRHNCTIPAAHIARMDEAFPIWLTDCVALRKGDQLSRASRIIEKRRLSAVCISSVDGPPCMSAIELLRYGATVPTKY